MMIMKFRSMKLSRSLSKLRCGKSKNDTSESNSVSIQRCNINVDAEVKWELRPGGMLVQKRDIGEESIKEEVILVRVVTGSRWHDISIQPTSTFGELKMILSMVTGLEPKEQRLLFKGKEREDEDYLHMVGVRDKDKVLMLQDPATKERKLATETIIASYRTIIV
ncbi:putative Ubiquitin-like domain-containing protein [Helianthus anomalus]